MQAAGHPGIINKMSISSRLRARHTAHRYVCILDREAFVWRSYVSAYSTSIIMVIGRPRCRACALCRRTPPAQC